MDSHPVEFTSPHKVPTSKSPISLPVLFKLDKHTAHKPSNRNESIDAKSNSSYPIIEEMKVDRTSLFTEHIRQESPDMWIKVNNPSDLPPVNYETDFQLEGQYYRISTSSGSDKLQKIYIKLKKESSNLKVRGKKL